jgi:hypothetical protein
MSAAHKKLKNVNEQHKFSQAAMHTFSTKKGNHAATIGIAETGSLP